MKIKDCIHKINNNTLSVPKKVLTEDLGKKFEMALCMLFEIQYNGKYKYSLEEAYIIKNRLYKLKEICNITKHIATNGNKYDFENDFKGFNVDIENDCYNFNYINAKTSKKNGKVCPQVIGQTTKKRFCEFIGIDSNLNLEQIKKYIEINVKSLLEIYILNTFECPIIYYNEHTDKLLFIRLKESIHWSNYNILFSHNIKKKKWNESSSIVINGITIGEFQIHNHRNCIKFRWSFEKLLNLFSENFVILYL